MADNSKIEWTDATWNPIRARAKEDMMIRGHEVLEGTWGYHCERISPGCKNCYASTMNGRMLPAWGTGLDYTVPNREKVEIFLDEAELLKPLKWKKPRRIFVESMSDWCADFVTDQMRDRIMAVAALCPQHTFLFLTKRAGRCDSYFRTEGRLEWIRDAQGRMAFPGSQLTTLPVNNVYLGFSAENQECFDDRWGNMRRLAAEGWKVWCSAEPLLGSIDMLWALQYITSPRPHQERLRWVIVGGESGHGARPCNVDWIRSIVRQCRDAGIPAFVKQMGAKPEEEVTAPRDGHKWMRRVVLKDRKGSDMDEWTEDLRVRQFPEVR